MDLMESIKSFEEREASYDKIKDEKIEQESEIVRLTSVSASITTLCIR